MCVKLLHPPSVDGRCVMTLYRNISLRNEIKPPMDAGSPLSRFVDASKRVSDDSPDMLSGKASSMHDEMSNV